MKELNAWLKTHRSEKRISPASWSDFPDDLKLVLENLAHDEAVRRADEFARDELLDLSRHDAVRQLVNAMAQAWTLSSEQVCGAVEDYIDELPPLPGQEFDKLVDKLFRRRVSIPWAELNEAIDRGKLAELVNIIVDEIAFPSKTVLDRSSYLNALQDTYDNWCSRQPGDAVKEVFNILGSGEKKEEIALADVYDLVKKRGGKTWAMSLDLEMEVGIEKATKDELVRIIKRYALLLKKKGGLPQAIAAKRGPDVSNISVPVKEEDISVEITPSDEIQEEPLKETFEEALEEELEVEFEEEVFEEEVLEEESATEDFMDEEIGEDEIIEEEYEEAPNSAEEEILDELIDDDSLEIEEVDIDLAEFEDEAEDITGEILEEELPESDIIDLEEEGTIEALFGSDDEEVKLDDLQLDEDTDDVSLEEIPPEETDFQDESKKKDFDLELEETGEQKVLEDEDFEEIGSADVIDSDMELEDTELTQEEEISDIDEVDEETVEETISDEEEVELLESDIEIEEAIGLTPDLEDDRFAELRQGPFRARLIKEMYDGKEDLLDVFLAKLSGVPDWKRAKQFIANELFRFRIDLGSELGEEFYLLMKRCLGG